MPIRLRLTLAFAVAMAFVLTAVGLLVYFRLDGNLRRLIDDSLQVHAGAVVALVAPLDSGVAGRLGHALGPDPDQGFAQVLDQGGRVLDETGDADLDRIPLLTPDEVARAHQGAFFLEGTFGDDRARLLAVPMRTAGGTPLVVVVGSSLEDTEQALATLRRELLIGGPIALLLASLVGYTLASAALRPVERMRRRAQAISTDEPGQRLPVGQRRDEIGRLGRTLNEMLERLELGMERERAFVADASHELRTPLALLKTEIELALDEPRTAAELRRALRSAGEETDRLTQLADDLLLLASADKGMLPIRREQVELDDLLAAVALRFERRADEAGRRILVEDAAASTVFADRLRLEQALGNLVENALRHGAGTVRLSARESGGRVELHVSDEGVGFPRDFLARAFERFSRADEARGRGGTGLGLAIVAAVARAHGGEAHAGAIAAGGADVWLELPITAAAAWGSAETTLAATG